MTNLKTYLSEMEGAGKEVDSLPWFKGRWSGQCFKEHCHNRDGCQYQYSKRDCSMVSSAKTENMSIIPNYIKNSTAYFIVTAANNHDTLVSMLKRCVEALELIDMQWTFDEAHYSKVGIPSPSKQIIKQALSDLERLISGGEK